MRLGVSSWCYRNESLLEAIKSVSSFGIKFMELFANGCHLDPRLNFPNVYELSNYLKEKEMIPLSLHTPFSRFKGNSGESIRKVWLKLIEECFKMIEILGITSMVIHPYVLVQKKRENLVPVNITNLLLKEILPQAINLKIRVLIENLSRFEYPYYWKLDHFYPLLGDSKTSKLGMCFDVSHCICSGLDPITEIRQFSSYIKEIHISSNVVCSKVDLHLPLDKGGMDWVSFFEFLKEEKFGGDLILEIDGKNDPRSAVGKSIQIIRDLLLDFTIEKDFVKEKVY